MTCPNRDGHIGTGGCIFCSAKGSGDFAGSAALSVTEQLAAGKAQLLKKRPVRSYIAYFQAFTNTYAPVQYLEKIFTEAIQDPEVKVLSIATRPDCLGNDVLDLLRRLNHIKPVWVELGLQTIHPQSAQFIRRGYELEVFDRAVRQLRESGITVIVHVILFLRGDRGDDAGDHRVFKPLRYTGRQTPASSCVGGNGSCGYLPKEPFHIPDMEEYICLLGKCILRLKPDIVIHRLTGDGPKELLAAPLWTGAKRTVLNRLHQYLKENHIWQGKEYHG